MVFAFDRSLFWGFRRIGFSSEPMKQSGPSVGLFARWILIGTVRIGWPSAIPPNKLKFDGVPADSVIAVTGPTGVLSCTGSPISDPPAAGMTLNVPFTSISPVCRLVFPVVVVMLPSVMLPCVEFDARQNATPSVLKSPFVASIAGSSTGQRKNDAHEPGPAWNSWSGLVLVPALLVAITLKW